MPELVLETMLTHNISVIGKRIHANTLETQTDLKVSQGLSADRNFIKHTSEMKTIIIPESMNNETKIMLEATMRKN